LQNLKTLKHSKVVKMKTSTIRKITAVCVAMLMIAVLSYISPNQSGTADAAVVSKSKTFGVSASCGKAVAHKVIEKAVRIPRAKLRAKASCASSSKAVIMLAVPMAVKMKAVGCKCGAGCPGVGVCACGCQ
jgi:hypothetical protein